MINIIKMHQADENTQGNCGGHVIGRSSSWLGFVCITAANQMTCQMLLSFCVLSDALYIILCQHHTMPDTPVSCSAMTEHISSADNTAVFCSPCKTQCKHTNSV